MIELDTEKKIIAGFQISLSLTDVFKQINNVIPKEQDLSKVLIGPYTSVKEAFEMMERYKCAQLPVIVGNEVLGYFSYQSFAAGLLRNSTDNIDIKQLPVEEFLDKPKYLQITDEISQLIDLLEKDEVAFIGLSNRLQAVITPFHTTKFLHGISYPFILLNEIELALRNLISACVSDEQLQNCIRVSFSEKFKRGRLPSSLEEMTYGDYLTLLSSEANWPYFKDAFGGEGEWYKARALTRLNEIRELRNVVFHFKRELTVDERRTLLGNREWILRKARAVEVQKLGV